MKRIEITIDSQGNSQIETKGFVGSSCVEQSKFLEAALGKQTSQRTTAAFYDNGVQVEGQAHESS